MQKNNIFVKKNLHNSKKSSTFAAESEIYIIKVQILYQKQLNNLVMTIFQENEQKICWGPAHNRFRKEIESKVSAVTYLTWRGREQEDGTYGDAPEPAADKWGWLNDLFEKYVGKRPYTI